MSTKTTTTSNTTPNEAQRPDIEPAFSENPDASAIMMALWRKAAPAMTDGELAWVAGAGEEVSASLTSITRLLTGIACLSGELEDGSHPKIEALKTIDILFPLINQLEVLSSLSFISEGAVHRLIKPSLYRDGGLLQGM
jgi:hypothetical protein